MRCVAVCELLKPNMPLSRICVRPEQVEGHVYRCSACHRPALTILLDIATVKRRHGNQVHVTRFPLRDLCHDYVEHTTNMAALAALQVAIKERLAALTGPSANRGECG
jgi:hypothetical protein